MADNVWNKFDGMHGTTPYSDWRVAANIEAYFRGSDFDPGKFALPFRFVPTEKSGGTGQGTFGSFLEGLNDLGEVHASQHYLQEDGNANVSAIAYLVPKEKDGQFQSLNGLDFGSSEGDDPLIELGPLVDTAILGDALEFSSTNEILFSTDETKFEPSFTCDWGKDDVICAIIDDSIGFANERFRKSLTETRIEALWIMDGANAPKIPDAYRVFGGLVLFRDQINDLLRKFEVDGAVDETALYQHMDDEYDVGLGMQQAATHGTHVLDLFAGQDMGEDTSQTGERPIIAVVLPQVAVRDTSGTHSEFFVQEGIDWIKSIANQFKDEHQSTLPMVANFSFGLLAGPHDGESQLEKTLSTIPARGNAAAVVPAGNGRASRTHAVAQISPKDRSFEIEFEISQNNRLSTFIEIWRPKGPVINEPYMHLTIGTPDGRFVETQPEWGGGYEWCKDGHLIMRTYHLNPARDPRQSKIREVAVIAILPTANADERLPLAPAGKWSIGFECKGTGAEEIDLWIQRGGSVYGHDTLGIQSRFTKYQDAISEEGTMSALATAFDVVSAGGYVLAEDHPPTDYTGAGTNRVPPFRPDAAAPADTSLSVPGIPASGTFSGSSANLSGTSVSTPQVARMLTGRKDKLGKNSKPFVGKVAGTKDPAGLHPLLLGSGRLFRPGK